MLFYANLIFLFFAVFAILPRFFFNVLKTVKFLLLSFFADVSSGLLTFNKNGRNARDILKKKEC